MDSRIAPKLSQHWFWPLAIALWAVASLIWRSDVPQEPNSLELALLIDTFVTLPLLYWLCYRGKMTGKAMLIRLVGLQCLGIWLASYIVPIGQQDLLPQLGWLRTIGIAIVVLVEIRIVAAVLKTVFKQDASEQKLVEAGMPEFIARLTLLEARFWRWLFGKFRQ